MLTWYSILCKVNTNCTEIGNDDVITYWYMYLQLIVYYIRCFLRHHLLHWYSIIYFHIWITIHSQPITLEHLTRSICNCMAFLPYFYPNLLSNQFAVHIWRNVLYSLLTSSLNLADLANKVRIWLLAWFLCFIISSTMINIHFCFSTIS